MADRDEHMKAHADQGSFAIKAAVNSVGAQCCRAGAVHFAQGSVRGALNELVHLMGEREAFEWIMKEAESIIRVPTESSKIWTPGTKG